MGINVGTVLRVAGRIIGTGKAAAGAVEDLRELIADLDRRQEETNDQLERIADALQKIAGAIGTGKHTGRPAIAVTNGDIPS